MIFFHSIFKTPSTVQDQTVVTTLPSPFPNFPTLRLSRAGDILPAHLIVDEDFKLTATELLHPGQYQQDRLRAGETSGIHDFTHIFLLSQARAR
jgi:hypothetical protein